jgi:predicted DNA-binding protein
MDKAMTLRLPLETAKDLEAIAQVDQIPVSEAVRSAIDAHIEARRKDSEFRKRLKQSIEENREILERLAR